MSSFAFAQHLLFAVCLFAVSLGLTRAMMRVGIVDIPNHRSSHRQPVPRSGGVAIVATAMLGFVAVYVLSDRVRIAERHMLGFFLGAAAITVVGLLDDLGKFGSFRSKLAGQIVATGILLASGLVIDRVPLPYFGETALGWVGYPVTLIWVLALTNIVNFMDGLDGMAAGTAVIAAAAFGVVTFLQGSHFVYILCYVLLAASLGFLAFNFPSARIFMGDVGSQFLGFVFAALAVIAAQLDVARTSIYVVPLLFFHFILDTVFTFFRRLRAGDDVTQGHRGHLYQLLNRMGHPHVRISGLYFLFAMFQGLAALILVRLRPDQALLVFLPFLVLGAVFIGIVVRAARRARLI